MKHYIILSGNNTDKIIDKMIGRTGTIHRTAYKPLLSEKTKKLIKKHHTPWMKNKYISSYRLDYTIALKEIVDLKQEDLELLEYMAYEMNVHYIEI